MKIIKYRCSCCNKIKDYKNKVYYKWSHREDVKDATVAICRQCKSDIKTVGIDNVYDYLVIGTLHARIKK
jgi:hypothetical protein